MSERDRRDHQPRHRRGSPLGGRFAPGEHAEGEVSLGAANGPAPETSTDLDLLVAATATGRRRTWQLVRHGEAAVRIAVSANPRLTEAQLTVLMDHDQPTGVRVAAARHGHRTALQRAAHDPNPFVRIWVRPAGHDEKTRTLGLLVERILPIGAYGSASN